MTEMYLELSVGWGFHENTNVSLCAHVAIHCHIKPIALSELLGGSLKMRRSEVPLTYISCSLGETSSRLQRPECVCNAAGGEGHGDERGMERGWREERQTKK